MSEEIKSPTAEVNPQEVPVLNEDGTPKVKVEAPEIKVDEKKEKIAKIVAKVKGKEKALTAKEQSIKEREAKILNSDEFKKLLETDPLAAIEKFGISKDKLYEKIVKSGEKPTVDEEVGTLKSELQKLKEEREADKAALEAERAERAIKEFKYEIKEYADSKKDNELKITHALGQTSAIYDVIEQELNNSGRLMPIEEAGKLVEEYFSKKGKDEYEKLKAIFEPKVEVKPMEDEEETITSPKTLTNKSTTIPSAEQKLLSAEESKRLLAKKYAGKLFI